MTTLIRVTAGGIVAEVARLLGDRVAETTATAGAAGTITGGSLPIAAIAGNDSFYNNLWIYLYSGTSAGDERVISAYAGATRVITVAPNWTATPDTTSKLIITRRFQPSLIYAAVVNAIREAAHFQRMPLTDTSLRVGNLLHNGHFEEWDGSAAITSGNFISTRLKSDGWSVQGTSATSTRESTVVRNVSPYDQYSALLQNGAANAGYLQWLVPNWGRWAGTKATVYGWVYATAATRARIFLNDGVNTGAAFYTGYHTGTAGWEELSISTSQTISAAATKLAIECRIETGGAISVYFDDIRLLPDTALYEVRVPAAFTSIQDIYQETGTIGQYPNFPLPRRWWDVFTHNDGHPHIRFASGIQETPGEPSEKFLGQGSVTKDRHLKVVGQGYRTDTVAVGTNVELDPQLVAYMAAADLVRSQLREPGMTALYSELSRARDQMMTYQPRNRVASGSVLVRA